MERKVEIVSREVIKPLSPTPNHLRHFKFSYLDQTAPTTIGPLALFYPPPLEGGYKVNSSRLLILKKSLSETLALFYPFAGRLKGSSIECNDEGVPFYEAFARNYQLQDVIRNLGTTEQFLPKVEGGLMFSNSAFPLLVQVTNFKCGGMMVAICASHKITDGATVFTLANAWAETARGSPAADRVVPKLVAAAEFLPPPIPHVPERLMLPESAMSFFFDEKRVTKLFTFGASTVASLKAKAMSDSVKAPTRVEAISALIWKCAMVANSGNDGTRPSQLAHAVNLRKRFVPPLPNYCVGNAVSFSIARKSENDGSDLPTLVACIRKGLSEMSSNYVDKQKRDDAILATCDGHTDLIVSQSRGETELHISSFCGNQPYVDFGWGKPSWVCSFVDLVTNYVLLIDARDGTGIEAFVCLKDKETMSVFEHELHLFLKSHLVFLSLL